MKKKGANFPETLIYWEDETYKNPFNSRFVFTFPAQFYLLIILVQLVMLGFTSALREAGG